MWVPLALVFLTAPAAGATATTATAARPTRILVLDVAGETLTKDEAGALRDRLAAEVSRRKNVEVISSEDMRRVLDVEAQKQAAGCDGGSNCLAEIGAALGADRVLYASVARLGSSYVMSLSLVDPLDARGVGRDSFQADSVEDAARRIPDAALRLFGKAPRPREAPVAAKGAPVVTIIGGVTAGIGAAAAAGFGLATFVASDTVQNPRASGAEKQTALQNGPAYLTATVVSAGVFAIGAGVGLIGLIVE